MNQFKRIVSMVLVAVMLLGWVMVGMSVTVSAAPVFSTVGGWNETIYATISGISDSNVTAVSYSGPSSGSLTGQDFEYLVRNANGGVRLDILGLKPGTYNLTVQTTSGTVTQSGIFVPAQDRSGYAHYNYTQGVGAYNDDGTLKENAIVLYVTDSNKNSVTVSSSDGTTVSGIGHILGSTGQDVGGGKTSKGGKANNNQDILRRLADDGTPLVVRIVGNVTKPDGTTAYDSIDYGGLVGDNGGMVRLSDAMNVTIEGVGADSTINGWGIHFVCSEAYPDYGKSFEVRNLTFRNVPEDCVGMEGVQAKDNSRITASVERCWVHNCHFIGPTISNPAESDKGGGDGACDFKRGQYFTNSYCIYDGYKKTNLVGADNNNLQYNITYHHNLWKNCESRGPLARTANIHMYNNVFQGQTNYCMNPRANCYIFSEYNWFYQSKDPVRVDSGAVKSYNDVFSACSGDNNATVVTNKNTTVSTSNKYANFDTNSSLSYIPSGNYILHTDIVDVKTNVLAFAGPQKDPILNPDNINTKVIPSNYYPTAAVVLPYEESLNSGYIPSTSCTVDNIVFNVSSVSGSSVKLGGTASGCDIVFYVNTAVDISITDGSGSYPIGLYDENGACIQSGTGTATDLPAGYYFIQIDTYDVTNAKYKTGYITNLKITAADDSAPTEPIPSAPSHTHSYSASITTAASCTTAGVRTYTCSCGNFYTETIAATGHNYVDGLCTKCGAADPNYDLPDDPTEDSTTPSDPSAEPTVPSAPVVPGSKYIHNFTTDGSTSEFYTITGTLSTGKGSTSYNGLSLTQCLMLDKTSSTVSFNAPSSGKLTMVFGGSTSDKNKKVMINGTGYTIDANNQVSIDIEAGSYTITRGSSSLNLWYVEYAPDSSDVHTHSYTAAVTAPTCTAAGYTTYTCSCGHSYTADEVAALGHNYSSAVTTEPSCEGTGVRTYTCAGCGHSYTESIAALGHSYKAVVTAPTCTAAGYTTYTCSVCGNSYTSNEVAATGHSYVDGICSVCGASDPEYVAPVDLFKLSGANVVLGNDLTMNFALLASNLNGTDYYAEIVKYNPDGTTITTTYPFSVWTPYANGMMYLITLDGLVAKQMSDKVEVTVYTGDGTQASYTWEDSIRDYAIRQLNTTSNTAKVFTVLADMLNYGAAAQVQFKYNTSDLANATMTDTHKSYETKTLDFGLYTNNQVVGDNFFGTILALETNIKMGVFFRGENYEGYTAKVSYRDHNGNAVSYEVAGKDFDATYAANGMYGIMVDTLVAGDVYQVVTVEVYNGSTLVASVSESMESYVVRQSASLLPIYDALMKFMVSSYNYSHN